MSDLERLLGDAAPQHDEQGDVAEGGGAKAPPPSPTVLKCDRWTQAQGDAACLAWREAEVGEFPGEVGADVIGALFSPKPEFAANPEHKARAEWWKQLMSTPEYKALHAQCVLDPARSKIAGASIANAWGEYAAEQPPDDEPAGDGPDGHGGIQGDLDRIRSTKKAMEAARDNLETAEDAAAGLGQGQPGAPLDVGKLASTMRAIRSHPQLAAILRAAGRYRRVAQAEQRIRLHAHRGEIAGIEPGGDVGRLLPAEAALVAGAIPELEMLALYRLASRRAACWKMSRPERVGAGPIVVVVDESGSMSGDTIAQAKGLALAMAWVAMHQRRWCALVGFSGGTEGHHVCFAKQPWDQEALIAWACHFYGGGTTCDVPLIQLPSAYWPAWKEQGLPSGKTDVVLVTDAEVIVPSGVSNAYRAWAEREKVKTWLLLIGQDTPGDLAAVADRAFSLDALAPDSPDIREVLGGVTP